MPCSHSNSALAHRLASLVRDRGGRAYYVGGYVRDGLLGQENKDIDIEIHGLLPRELEEILDSLGQRVAIGESFGIYSLKGCSLDIAMPRKEQLRGRGHRDFDILVDPFIGTEGAALRRDFTINALMQDVLTGEILDHFGGKEDLNRGILRHVSDASFAEDPLRVLRGAQFAARFCFQIAEETLILCRKMDLSALSRERVEGELKKALLKADRPSVFFEALRQMDQLDFWFPELKALIGIGQNLRFHAEGDVWNHTMLVLDEAAKLRHRAANPLWFMLSALAHDFGKATTTDGSSDAHHAYDHETAGIPLAETFLRRITGETKCIEYVKNMTGLHMKPNIAAGANSSVKSTNRLFDQSVDPEGLICLAVADDKGRISCMSTGWQEGFLIDRLQVYREYMARPHVTGRDLIAAGLEPAADFSDILAYAHKLRLAGIEKESALKQSLAFARQSRRKKHKRLG